MNKFFHDVVPLLDTVSIKFSGVTLFLLGITLTISETAAAFTIAAAATTILLNIFKYYQEKNKK
jgi:hypothetical protein